jgi:S-adenosylmethionine decarboxylase
MAKGKHLIIDCRNVDREVCIDDEHMLDTLNYAIRKAGAKVLTATRHNLGHNSPPGYAIVLALDESHLSAHSYADEGLIAMDLFTCGATDPMMVLEYIKEKINLGDNISIRQFDRFI